MDQPKGVGFFHNIFFDQLYGNGIYVDAKYTTGLTGSRADSSRKFRKVVGIVETIQRILPATVVDKVVPFRNKIVDGTARRHVGHQVAGMAKRNSAINAPSSLRLQFVNGHVVVELVPVQNAQKWFPILWNLTLKFFEASWLSHRSVFRLRLIYECNDDLG